LLLNSLLSKNTKVCFAAKCFRIIRLLYYILFNYYITFYSIIILYFIRLLYYILFDYYITLFDYYITFYSIIILHYSIIILHFMGKWEKEMELKQLYKFQSLVMVKYGLQKIIPVMN
jgi:hypothetical protein